MAKLTAKKRKALPSSAFAYPSVRKYPINDKTHARAALSQAAKSSTYGTYAHVAALHNLPYLELRGISNLVEDRDLSRWRLNEAAVNVAASVVAFVTCLPEHEMDSRYPTT